MKYIFAALSWAAHHSAESAESAKWQISATQIQQILDPGAIIALIGGVNRRPFIRLASGFTWIKIGRESPTRHFPSTGTPG
jgi:hypothetical protein